MGVEQAFASWAERTLLIHRLREIADTHELLAEVDDYADTAETLTLAKEREPALCAALLREAVWAMEMHCV